MAEPWENVNIEKAKQRIRRDIRSQVGDDIIRIAEWLRLAWHGHFGDGRCLNDERARAVKMLLRYEITPHEVWWAIEAYAHECTTSPGRLASPTMRRTFDRFVGCLDVVERYIPLGAKLRADREAARRRAEQRREVKRETTTAAGLQRTFDALSKDDQDAYVARAVEALAALARPGDVGRSGTMLGSRTFANPLVRGKVFQLLQRDLVERSSAPSRIDPTEALR